MENITYTNLVLYLLKQFPELVSDYNKSLHYRVNAEIDQSTLHDLDEIRLFHGIPQSSEPLGTSIVLEDLLVPFIIDLVQHGQLERLGQALVVMETLANSSDLWIKNQIAACFCQPLITTYEDYLPQIFPFLGVQTRQLCKLQLNAFQLSSQTIKMFN